MSSPRIAAVILAAGAATRFGSPKQLATFHGEPLVWRAIRTAQECGVSHVVVVLGAHADGVAATIGSPDGLSIVVNRKWSTGMASSIRAGVAAASDDSVDAILLLTVDQPLVGATELARLIDEFASGSDIVAAEYSGVVGVPAIVATSLLPCMTDTLSGDRGAGSWLRAQGSRVRRVRMDSAAYDADTVRALRAAAVRSP